MSLNLGLLIGEFDCDEEDEDAILSVFFPPIASTEESLRVLLLLARDDQHDRRYFRMAFEKFLQKPVHLFREYFRITQDQFGELTSTLRSDLERGGDCGRLGYPPELKVALSLIVFGRGESFRGLEPFGVSRSAAQTSFHQFMNAVMKHYSDRIKMPVEFNADAHYDLFVKKAGNRISYSPKIVGAIDGTHIRILPPRTNAKPYYNRKNFPSLNVQAVVDGNSRFMHVYVGAPGCVNDARVFMASDVIDLLPNPYIILAYPLRVKKTLTPVKDNGYWTELDLKYNEIHSSLRMVVDRAFGISKNKWAILKDLQFTNQNDTTTWESEETSSAQNAEDSEITYGSGTANQWRKEIMEKMFH